jgi:glycerol-3-phosphate dehydrogenase
MNRDSNLNRLQTEEFDICIIGGGASGAGCALDAALRGLKVALIEKEDFAAETSSKSTKLIHGGVRYLEQAFKNFDFAQLKQVRHGLEERF